MSVWRTRRTLKSAVERMTANGASRRPRLVCLCAPLVVSLALFIAVAVDGEVSIESVFDVDVRLRSSIPPE
jgi:hypothetical protein